MSPLDLRRILLDLERILRPETRSKRISLRLDLPSSLPAVVGNRTQLVEVLMNLRPGCLRLDLRRRRRAA